MRTFIAIKVLDDIKSEIYKIVEELKKISSGVKWVEKENLHITLKFLGEIKEKDLEILKDTLKDILSNIKIFEISFEGISSFPAGKSPRVIWIGIEKGKEILKNIANLLEASLSKKGFRKEDREFTAHLTIGRVKDKNNLGKIVDEINSKKDIKFGRQIASSVCIMKSTLTREGPIYEVLEEIYLK